MIYIENHRRKPETLRREYPDAIVLDLTSHSAYAQQLSPFYPHGGIPVPFSPGITSMSVEGVWQGLKVFDGEGIAPDRFRNATMKGLKRTVRTLGPCRGHLRGTGGDSARLLSYVEARREIYVPTYRWMLAHCPAAAALVARIGAKAETCDLVFLDYNTNANLDNTRTPLSHAALVRTYIEERYPKARLPHGTVLKKAAQPKRKRKAAAQPDLFNPETTIAPHAND